MENEKLGTAGSMHTLISLEDYKAILGIDDREDVLSRYCLITATYSIEQYCRRRIFLKKRLETVEFTGDSLIPLREYPVRKILTIHKNNPRQEPVLISPNLYRCIPECGITDDMPFCIEVSPGAELNRLPMAIQVKYWAGYKIGEVPPDLASACLELAAWNMNRFRGKRIGMTGAVRGQAGIGEFLELVMPQNVRELLEPYRRRVI
jgi:hypothetical protein